MIGRRELIGAAAGTAALAQALRGEVAAAASPAEATEAMQRLATLDARGMKGRLPRLGRLDLESQQDFTLGLRRVHSKQVRLASLAAFERLLEAEGIDPATPMTIDEVRARVTSDPIVNLATKAWLLNQQITWKTLRDHYHQYADHYLSQMEAADKQGPGTLVLAPRMAIPEYACHEIHIQPGGYVGDPFAGHIYHYGTNSFYVGQYGDNEQDEIHRRATERLPVPADGKVRRILDMGCGVGQMTLTLQERFPDAEVWGIDVGGPMVRYAHLRANRFGSRAHFAQALAQRTGFPDGHFDIVVSYIIHHEMPAAATREVVAEAGRITRPGGVYYPIDFHTGGSRAPARAMYNRWWDHRWNNEVWSLEYHEMNLTQEVTQRGFRLVEATPPAFQGFGARHFVKV